MGRIAVFAISLLLAGALHAQQGVKNVESSHGVAATADKLEAVLKKKGMNVFARIDHAAGASKVGHELRPTQLLIFGNPKVGSPLMKCAQTVALDLPQKALVWQDAAGKVWLSYNDPMYLSQRHGVGECGGVLKKVSGALANFAAAATN